MTCRKRFEIEVDAIKYSLEYCVFEFEKVEVEYALYDTNVDSKWILGL